MYLYLSSSSTKWLTPARFVFLIFFRFFFLSEGRRRELWPPPGAEKTLAVLGGGWYLLEQEKKREQFYNFSFSFFLWRKRRRTCPRCYVYTNVRTVLVITSVSSSTSSLNWAPPHRWSLSLSRSNRSDRLSKSIQENGSVQMTAGGYDENSSTNSKKAARVKKKK